jgi:hypothetical protein
MLPPLIKIYTTLGVQLALLFLSIHPDSHQSTGLLFAGSTLDPEKSFAIYDGMERKESLTSKIS